MDPEQPEKQNKSIRKPRQKRSIEMKEKILNTALALFCEKGYYRTNTNEIAQKASVSISSLYSYFKDKDTIFLEILNRYHDGIKRDKTRYFENRQFTKQNLRPELRSLIDTMAAVHEKSKELNRELLVLSYYDTKVAQILAAQKQETLQTVMNFFKASNHNLGLKDPEAVAIITFDLLSATIDRISIATPVVERERLIEATIDMIACYLT